MSIRLTPMAEECIQCMYLTDAGQEKIRNCVIQYAEPNLEKISPKQLVSLVIFHISEAVKWLCSVVTWQNLTTWQIATSTIKNRALELAAEQGATPQEVNQIRNMFPFTMDLFSRQALNSCIVYNKCSTGAMFESSKNYFDLRSVMQNHIQAVRS